MSAGISVVRFRTGNGDYAVLVEHVRGVRTTEGMLPLPTPGAYVVGLLPDGDRSLTIVNPLGPGHDRVLVLDPDGERFGLLVDEVSGVVAFDPENIGPPPAGQTDDIISGVLRGGNDHVLLVDARTIARVLVR